MGITSKDIYEIEHILIGKVFENESDEEGLGKTERMLSKIRGMHTMTACVINKLERVAINSEQ